MNADSSDIHTIELEVLPGDHIEKAAKRLCEAARAHGYPAKATFNDVLLVATPGETTPGDLCQYYDDECERRARAWQASPEGQAEARQREREIQQLQSRCDDLIRAIDTLDFGDLNAVIDWLTAFQPLSDDSGVVILCDYVISTFAHHGYRANENIGGAYDESDRTNVARYLIGQAMDGLHGDVHAIHPVFRRLADEWREKFPM